MPKSARARELSPSLSTASIALLLAIVAMALPGTAQAGPGYQLDSTRPSFPLGGEYAHGVAVDQEGQLVYVSVGSTNSLSAKPGRIEQFDAGGTPTPSSPFTTGESDFFSAVAVNPLTRDVYAYQTEVTIPTGGKLGSPRMNTFSPTGIPGPSFVPPFAAGPQIAIDSAGRIFYPNDVPDKIEVFDSSGALKATIACAGCPGGPFNNPGAVALDPDDNLYVADFGSGRVIKFTPVGATYAYDSILQSGHKAVAVAVDPTSGDILVGNMESEYHVVAFTSDGVQFDDFGATVIAPPPLDSPGQIAVNGATHKVYVTDPTAEKAWVFERVTSIPAPSASTDTASALGQLDATLKATVNPNGHGLTDCRFQYAEEGDLQANGWSNAIAAPCFSKPGGSKPVPVSAAISGLSPDTPYAYRVLAASYGGSVTGSAQSFTTLPPNPPQVATEAASALAQTKATLAGTVNPRGGLVSECRFQYVAHEEFQTDGYANADSALCSPVKPAGSVAVAVIGKVAELAPDTTYSYRVLATSNAGSSTGADLQFTTLADTCATDPSLCPLPPPSLPDAATPPDPPVPLPAPGPSAAPQQSPPASPMIPQPPKPSKCRKGFRKKQVKGRQRCVKLRKGRSSRGRGIRPAT